MPHQLRDCQRSYCLVDGLAVDALTINSRSGLVSIGGAR